ncbi:MAG: transporter substrate-binding domain-containing protein [Lachnospiraceae bacterium]|nr:transporter substrate-binding domain-containing protein [Lachnospiraceae bacterium]
MKKKISVMLICALTVCAALAGCGKKSGQTAKSSEDMVYAVEAGSAGEEIAKANGFKVNVVASQADALMEVASGTSDAAIIDLLMAGAMIGEGTSYPQLTHTVELTSEKYVVGCRKGSDMKGFIDTMFQTMYEDGSMQEIAKKYGVQDSLVKPEVDVVAVQQGGDSAYIREKGTLIVGITDFAPMDYTDENGEWIGFDADMARALAEEMGLEIKFVEIDWDNKTMELDSKNIDLVWNGMTLTDEVAASMNCSVPYCNNAQVVVVPAK